MQDIDSDSVLRNRSHTHRSIRRFPAPHPFWAGVKIRSRRILGEIFHLSRLHGCRAGGAMQDAKAEMNQELVLCAPINSWIQDYDTVMFRKAAWKNGHDIFGHP